MHYLFDFKHDLNIYILNICEYYVTEMYIMHTCMLFILLSVCLSVCLSVSQLLICVFEFIIILFSIVFVVLFLLDEKKYIVLIPLPSLIIFLLVC